jgi:hypothetical protein
MARNRTARKQMAIEQPPVIMVEAGGAVAPAS